MCREGTRAVTAVNPRHGTRTEQVISKYILSAKQEAGWCVVAYIYTGSHAAGGAGRRAIVTRLATWLLLLLLLLFVACFASMYLVWVYTPGKKVLRVIC